MSKSTKYAFPIFGPRLSCYSPYPSWPIAAEKYRSIFQAMILAKNTGILTLQIRHYYTRTLWGMDLTKYMEGGLKWLYISEKTWKFVFRFLLMSQKYKREIEGNATQKREKIRHAKHLQYGIKIKIKPRMVVVSYMVDCLLAHERKGRKAIRESNRRRAKLRQSLSGEQNI